MRFGFSYIGLIWLILLFVPNMIWTKNKPQDYEKYVESENKVLLALERVGQFIVTPVALLFSDFNYKGSNFWTAVLLASFLCMVLYEVWWIRYFKSEKTLKDFYRGILGIPVAGATLPVIAFLLLGIYGGARNIWRKYSDAHWLSHTWSRSYRNPSAAQERSIRT